MTDGGRWQSESLPYTVSDLLTVDPLPVEQLRLPYDEFLPLRFVLKRHRVEKHGRTWLHTDVRLEACGRLLSWVSDSHPSLDPARPIALVEMPDHQLKHIDGERCIPEGQYGSGPMVVWDLGSYRPLAPGVLPPGRAVVEALRAGRLNFWMEGVRLRGAFRLEIVRGQWQLAKLPDSSASTSPVLWDDRSVITGRTLDEVAAKGRRAKRPPTPPEDLFGI